MAWPEDLPLLLAGPIVRRVEPTLASVWVALRQPADVTLRIWEGIVDAGTGEPPLLTGERTTRSVGSRLHVAVVMADDDEVELRPGQVYSYDVVVTAHGGDVQELPQDLRSLGLLSAEPAPREPLGYAAGRLPGFALPPPDLSDLRVAHASCRKMHDGNDPGPDALTWLDRLVEREQGEAASRLHQLYLTGDQIYADNVAVPVLPTLSELGNYVLGVVEHVEVGGKQIPVDQAHLPTGWRAHVLEAEAHLTGKAMQSHLLSLAEYCAMYLLAWSSDVWPPGGPSPPGTDPASLADFPREGGGTLVDRELRALLMGVSAAAVDALDEAGCRDEDTDEDTGEVAREVAKVCAHRDELAKDVEKATELVERYRAGVGTVRRLLANVPTYMIFDDHEVTDDWNITKRWADRVTSTPLGRAVLRNGLLAYALFQGEGNDPRAYTGTTGPDAANAELLELAARVVPATSGPLVPGPTGQAEQLLGLSGPDPPQVRWHYQVPGTRHRTVVLDTRTRRAFGGETSPAALVAPPELERQLPEGPLPTGLEVLLLVSAAPVLGPPMIEVLGAPVIEAWGNLQYHRGKSERPGHIAPDREAWAHEPVAFETLLSRLASHRRVVVLSGDVHYAMTAALTYWGREAGASRVVQLTSSGSCNSWPWQVPAGVRSLSFAQRLLTLATGVEQLAWSDARPLVVDVPSDHLLSPAVRFRLDRSPVRVLNQGWPTGTSLARGPDWVWRLDLLADARPVGELPEAARPLLREDVDPDEGIAAYHAVTQQHGDGLATVTNSRRLVWLHNVGLVSFEEDRAGDDPDGGGPSSDVVTVRHDILSRHPQASPPDAPDVYTAHRAPLDSDEPMPTTLRLSGETR